MSKDLFSKQSDSYARYRPGYPASLIEYILQFLDHRNFAWDCATGNGQAASLLAPHFQRVEATDISSKQISNSIFHPRIHYSISSAEKTVFPEKIFDLITVAQAYHWFDFTAFETEVKRVLKPDGILAVWAYSLVSSSHHDLNKRIKDFYENTVGSYWDPERKYIDDHYRTIPFPYKELSFVDFFLERKWDVQDLSGYLNTWSSVQHFIDANGYNPVDDFKHDLEKAWPAENTITFQFPLFLRIGRPESA